MLINWRGVHVLVSMLLLATGAFFLTRAAQEWNPPWCQTKTRPAAAPQAARGPADFAAGDPALEPAKVQVYGVLASSAVAPNTAAPAPPVRAAAIDHIVA